MFKQLIQDRKTVFGIWQRIPSSVVSEILCISEVDFVAVDMEHGAIDISDLRTMIPVFKRFNIPVILRVAASHPSFISKVLDLGVDAIMVPQVNTADEARRAVAASKFAPIGKRGIGGSCAADRYGDIGLEEFVNNENKRISTMIQIETVQAIDNLDEICAVEGIDLFYIGPIDLSQALGVAGQMNHPLLIETMQSVIDKIKSAGKLVGMHGVGNEFIEFWNARGVSCFTIGMDSAFLKQNVRNTLQTLKQ